MFRPFQLRRNDIWRKRGTGHPFAAALDYGHTPKGVIISSAAKSIRRSLPPIRQLDRPSAANNNRHSAAPEIIPTDLTLHLNRNLPIWSSGSMILAPESTARLCCVLLTTMDPSSRRKVDAGGYLTRLQSHTNNGHAGTGSTKFGSSLIAVDAQ